MTALEISDSLEVFNDILEQWSTDSLSLWGQATETFQTVAGQKVYTIGPTGNWVTTRSQNISEDAYTELPAGTGTPASFICESISQQQYNDIAVKDQQNQWAMKYLYVNDFPNGILTLWPVPSVAAPFTFASDRILTGIVNAGTTISYPPGYAKAFKAVLAVELAPYFGKQASQDVKDIARDSYASIKRANKRPKLLQFDGSLRRRSARSGFYWAQ